MRTFLVMVAGAMLLWGCAHVQVDAPKEPIKVDISMRLDVYQHVTQDINDIENMVTGEKEKPQSKNSQNLFGFFVAEAYAQEELSPEAEQAALRRKDRRSELASWQRQGVIGENKSGLVELRDSGRADPSVQELINAENNDRLVIYQWIAQKNGITMDEVKKLYAARLQADAPSGTPIEVDKDGSSAWEIK
ncbi:MAG: DUF1318 domain-containing protein [Candidatus Omnitrophica bacterium]|nr:DUF1318 domain-containing protein [Candidatus Omnitrophota bacterium]